MPLKFCTVKLLSCSISLAIAWGLVGYVPKQVIAQTQPPRSAQQSAELDTAGKMSQQAFKLHEQGKYAEAISLMERAIAVFERIMGKENPVVGINLTGLAVFYQSQRDYPQAEALYLRSIAILEKAFGRENPNIAVSLNQLAGFYTLRGNYSQAEASYLRIVAIREKALGTEHPDVATSLNNLAGIYRYQRNYKKAEPLYIRALSIREKVLGKEHPDVAQSLNNLGLNYGNQRNYQKAEPLYLRALAIREKVQGKEHPEVATTLTNLAEVYRSQGNYRQAEPLYLRALAIREKVQGKEHPDISTTLNNVAGFYNDQGNYAKAESLYLRAIAISEKFQGKEHPDMATSVNNLAEVYRSQGKYSQAEPLYLRSLSIREKILGKEHPDVAVSLNNLASLYQLQGNYGKAEPMYLQALAIYEKVFGQEDPYVALSLSNLALLYNAQGNYDKAEALLLRSLSIREKVQGKEHPDMAMSLNNLAELYRSQGKYSKAAGLFGQALTIWEKALGKEHPLVGVSLNNLAEIYRSQGDYVQAEAFHLRSLSIREKVQGKEHPDVALSLSNLAGLYRDQGNNNKAESLYLRAIAIYEKVLGKEHPNLANSLNRLAEVYQNQGNYSQAAALLRRSLAISEKTFGQEHIDVATSLNGLAINYYQQGDYSQAEALLKRSLAIVEKKFGSEHPDVASSFNNLAEIYRNQGNHEKAETFLLRSLTILEKILGKEHPDLGLQLSNLASLYWRNGDINRTANFLTRGLTIEEKKLQLIYAVGSEARKQNYAQTFAGKTYFAVSLAIQSANKNPNLARLAATTVLRRKGRVLDAMTDTVQTLQTQFTDNPETKKIFTEWLNVQQQLANLVYRGAGEQKFEIYQQQIKQLEAEKERLEEQVSVKSAEFRQEIRPVELADIQAKIPLDGAMVEIVQYQPFNPRTEKTNEKWSKSRYAAVVLRHTGEPKWVDLGDSAAIDKSVTSFRQVLATPPGSSERGIDVTPVAGKNQTSKLQEIARNLDQQVMAPIRPLLGNTRHILLSPDGQLNLIPFEALKDEQNKYLVENYAFSYLTTGRDLLRLDTPAKQLSHPVVFADINYDRQETDIKDIAKNPAVSSRTKTRSSQNRRSADFTNLMFGKLNATLTEGEEIKKIFPETNIITGEKATETAIKQLQAPSILHLATHGFFLPDREIKPSYSDLNNQLEKPQTLNLENPLLRSGLALAGFNNRQNQQNNNTEDGVLTALEVAGLNLRGTQLVVLSACETGLGNVKTGDGVYGLRRSLVIAGTQTQLLSLWQVDDAGTKDLMVKYYEKIKAKKGRHAALREAQLEFLKNPNYQHPYYWASFIPSGNWQEMK
ncbi:peptidase-like protein [Calothrix sp. NIES-4101]|nr:peptidase-like protein [Calothrix sp. NIES-4101]